MSISLSNPLGTDIIPVGFNYGLTQVATATPPPTPAYIIDYLIAEGFSTADMHGYSFRKVYSTYTGNCCRVRRNTDNAETDIGFDINGNFDEATAQTFLLGSFPPSNTLYVTKMYDQYGTTQYRAQPTATDQPIIYQSGQFTRNVNNRVCCYLPDVSGIGGNSSWYQFDNTGTAWNFTHAHLDVWTVFANQRQPNRSMIYSAGFYNNASWSFACENGSTSASFGRATIGNVYHTPLGSPNDPIINLTGTLTQRQACYDAFLLPEATDPNFMDCLYHDINLQGTWGAGVRRYLFGGFPNFTWIYEGLYMEEIFCQHTTNPTTTQLQNISDNQTQYFYP